VFDEAIVAFLPQDGSWCAQDFPHMTLVAAGPVDDLSSSEQDSFAKDAISAARVMGGPFSLPVTGVEQLGITEIVDALMLYPNPQLLVARSLMESWNRSEFKEFNPHATIGPAGSAFTQAIPFNDGVQDTVRYKRQVLPSQLYFDRMAVCFGPNRLVFAFSSLY